MDKYQGLSVCACHPEKKGDQDQSKGCGIIHRNDEYEVLAVSAGGKQTQYFRSHLGARFAVEAASDALRAFASSVTRDMLFADERNQSRLLRQLEGSIITAWKALVRAHLKAYPFQPEEIKAIRNNKYKENYKKGIDLEYAYRANVTAAIVAKDYCLMLQNGDGECWIMKNRSRSAKIRKDTIPKNDKCEKEYSTAMCDKTALREFRYCCLDTAPAAIFLAAGSRQLYSDKAKEDSVNLDQIAHELMLKGAERNTGLKEKLACLCRKEKLDYLCMACLWTEDIWSKRLKTQVRAVWEKYGLPFKKIAYFVGSAVFLLLIFLIVYMGFTLGSRV